MKKRILSGMRPTGPLHIGHLAGALKNWVRLQEEYECYFMIADWHALMSEYEDPRKIDEYTKEMMLDWLSCGLDMNKSVLFIQSHVPEHLEMYMTFSLLTPLGWLERNPTYKEQLREIKGRDLTTYGFLGYPVLQGADIALYKANAVPVGADQLPHLELTRETIRRFHSLYRKNVFPEPEALLTDTPKLLGIDNRKMSKSYDNFIAISEDPDNIRKKTQKMITDPERIKLSDKGHPDRCTVFSYYKVFTPHDKIKEIEECCKNAYKGCTECKKAMAELLIEYLGPMREKRKWLKDRFDERALLPWRESSKKARDEARKTMFEIRKILHIYEI